jgi:hypothetical protein
MTFARLLAVLIVFGWLAAVTPFRGDQALFVLYAKQMLDGKHLYAELWDVTNPGIYGFYYCAGSLFGFDEDGIHFAEWLWFTAFAISLSYAIRIEYRLQYWPLMPGLLLGGWYYATSTADPSHLTKVEGLVAFPMFLAIWLTTRARWYYWLLAGVAGGIVVLFKFAFAICLLAAWLPDLIKLRIAKLLLILAGILLPLTFAALHFERQGSAAAAKEALFVDTRSMLAAAEPAGFPRLASSVRCFLETSTPLLVLAAAGSLLKRDRFTVASWMMLPAAAVVILIQKWSWWSYHFLLLSLPLAVMACYTWPVLKQHIISQYHRHVVYVYALVFIMFLPPLSHGGLAVLRLCNHRGGFTASDRRAAMMQTGRAYEIAFEEAQWWRSEPRGSCFIAGDPLIASFSGCEIPVRYHGWSLELFSPSLWDKLADQLEVKPPEYVYISHDLGYGTLIAAKSPRIEEWLKTHYRIVRTSSNGEWHRRR